MGAIIRPRFSPATCRVAGCPTKHNLNRFFKEDSSVDVFAFLGSMLHVLAQAASSEAKPISRLAAGIAIGVGGIGPGIGIGIAVNGALQAIGRNPETAGEVRTTMILGAGLAEAVAIYAFVTALVLIFV